MKPLRDKTRLLAATLLLLFASPLAAQGNCYELKSNASATSFSTPPRGRLPVSAEMIYGLRIVSERIDDASGINTTLVLCNDGEPNAFAIAGEKNIVGISVGMVKLLGDDWHAYAAVLGHENAHLVKGHSGKRRKREIGLGIVQTLTNVMAPEASQILSYPIAGYRSTYSQEQELESDKLGMKYAHCAGFAGDGGIRVHGKLKSNGRFFASHPSSRYRIDRLRTAIRIQQRNPDCRK